MNTITIKQHKFKTIFWNIKGYCIGSPSGIKFEEKKEEVKEVSGNMMYKMYISSKNVEHYDSENDDKKTKLLKAIFSMTKNKTENFHCWMFNSGEFYEIMGRKSKYFIKRPQDYSVPMLTTILLKYMEENVIAFALK